VVTLPPPHGPAWLDLSMIHLRCSPFVAAASHMRGATAVLCDRRREASTGHMQADLHPSHNFVPPSVEKAWIKKQRVVHPRGHAVLVKDDVHMGILVSSSRNTFVS
jgi:hypothetical protein